MIRTEGTLRPIDLAREAGISTQQIRNYADAGILPPTKRTAAGYRQFHARHRHALLAFRALANSYGQTAAQSIMCAIHADDLPRALTLVNASHAALHEQRLSLQAAGEALEAVAAQIPDAATAPRSPMRIGEMAAHLGVRTSALRVWESAGLLIPRREPGTRIRRFGSSDVRDAQMIKMLRGGRYPLSQIRTILDGLRQTGSSDALRAAITRRRTVLTRQAKAMLEGSSHLHHYITG